MSWQLIQEIRPLYEWQLLDIPIIGETTIRVEQDWAEAGAFPGRAYVSFCQEFMEGSRYNFRRLYPYREPRLITCTIPEPLEAAGWGVFYLAVKLNLYARYDADANWRIRFYEWVGSTPPPATPDPGSEPDDPNTPDVIYDGGT